MAPTVLRAAVRARHRLHLRRHHRQRGRPRGRRLHPLLRRGRRDARHRLLHRADQDAGKLHRGVRSWPPSGEKPIVMLKIGRSEAGRSAALAHTGSLVGSDDVIDAVMRKLGISRVYERRRDDRDAGDLPHAAAAEGRRRRDGLRLRRRGRLAVDLAAECGINVSRRCPRRRAASCARSCPSTAPSATRSTSTGQARVPDGDPGRVRWTLAEAPGIDSSSTAGLSVVVDRQAQRWADARGGR